MFSPRRNASSMPRFTFALRSWMKAAWYDDEIGSRSVACGFELSNPSMAPTSRTLISVASSPVRSDSIVLRLSRDRSSTMNHAMPRALLCSSSILATV